MTKSIQPFFCGSTYPWGPWDTSSRRRIQKTKKHRILSPYNESLTMRPRMMMLNHFYPCCMVFEKYPTSPHEWMSNNSLAERKVERVKRLPSCHPVHSPWTEIITRGYLSKFPQTKRSFHHSRSIRMPASRKFSVTEFVGMLYEPIAGGARLSSRSNHTNKCF